MNCFGHEERLRQEALDLAGARDDEFVLFRQFVHAENGDDVLQRLVLLQDLLNAAGDVVVLLADDVRIEDARGRVERVDGRVDALFRDRAVENGLRVQVGERGGRGRVGQVVGGHVDGLHRGDRALGGRGDALLQRAHVGRERRLVAHRRRNTAEQRRHFRTRLREAEDVVDEEEDVLALVAEVFRDGEARERDAGARARRLVHLAEHQRAARLAAAASLVHARLDHLVIEVVAFARALADAGEHGVAAIGLRDVVDQLLDQHGLADAGAAEQADLAALRIGAQQVDDLDARRQDFRHRLLIDEGRGELVDAAQDASGQPDRLRRSARR